MKNNIKFAMLGGGSWATAIVKMLTENADVVNWYMRNTDAIEHIRTQKHNPNYLSSVEFHIEQLNLTDNINEAVADADVGPDRPQIPTVIDPELHVGADQPGQQHPEVGEHVGEVEHLGPQRLLAGEGQQLPDQRGGAVGVLLDVHDVGEGLVRRPMIGQKQVGRHDDRSQHIVEIMRDAAGQLTYRLHLLALRHLPFEHLLFGGVDGIDDCRFFGAFPVGATGDVPEAIWK